MSVRATAGDAEAHTVQVRVERDEGGQEDGEKQQ
ncbi:hypothetical protein BH24ACT21_BH24ACT21_13820 [soil metagenome]